jgi:hypothetical protein
VKEKETSKDDVLFARLMLLMNSLWGKESKELSSFLVNWSGSDNVEEELETKQVQSMDESKQLWELYTGRKIKPKCQT